MQWYMAVAEEEASSMFSVQLVHSCLSLFRPPVAHSSDLATTIRTLRTAGGMNNLSDAFNVPTQRRKWASCFTLIRRLVEMYSARSFVEVQQPSFLTFIYLFVLWQGPFNDLFILMR